MSASATGVLGDGAIANTAIVPLGPEEEERLMHTMENYPSALTSLPVVSLPTDAVNSDGKFALSLERCSEVLAEYKSTVESFLLEKNMDCESDVAPIIEFALRIVIAENFTGELVESERKFYAPVISRFALDSQQETRLVHRLLVSDGEMPNMCVRFGALLLLCIAIAESKTSSGAALLSNTCIWRLRTYFMHQLMLERKTFTIFSKVADSVEALLKLPDAQQTPEMLVELGNVQSYYHRREESAATVRRAARLSGVTLEESAMLGVRTRWQQHEVHQMVLNARSADHACAVFDAKSNDALFVDGPKVVMGEKDGHDMLDRPRHKSNVGEEGVAPASESDEIKPLVPVDKAIVLALCQDINNTNPYHGLTRRYMLTYVERIIVDPARAPFMISAHTLLLRARLESRINRVQERAYLQMAELVDQFSGRRDPTKLAFPRTDSQWFYLVAYPTIWSLKSEFADFCMEENLVKTALDVYEQTFNWEKIIECCKALDKRKRAESLAQDLLRDDPENPMLWVALGEATREDAHLWKAWELSNHKMAAPMRALGRLALEREHFDKVVEYFDEAVRINPVFGGDWFGLGFASMKLNDFERSGTAFTRVCQMDPNNAYAWNNLSSVMLRQGKTRPAFNAMGQALRNNRRNWRMWQNYCSIGCELNEVTECTNALNIALDIGGRSIELDAITLEKYGAMCIRYLKGEIPSTSRDQTDDDSGIAFHPTEGEGQEVEELDDTGLEGVMPLGADVEMPESFFPEKNRADEEKKRAIQESIRQRFRDRLRETIQHITNVFVNNEDIYAMAATVLNYLDGPLRSFEYRLKELRCCRQKDQWERVPELFDRTVQCFRGLVGDALAAREALEKGDYSALARPKQKSEKPNPGEGEGAAGGAAEQAKSDGEEEAFSASNVEAIRTSVDSALKAALSNIDAAIEVAEKHLDYTDSFAKLEALRGKVNKALKEPIKSSA